MKMIFKTVLPALLLLLSLNARADEAKGGDQGRAVRKTLQNYFRFPGVLMPAMENSEPVKVEVLFTTDRDGYVNFVLARSENKLLKEEIEKQFYLIPLKGLNENVVHKVVLTFRLA